LAFERPPERAYDRRRMNRPNQQPAKAEGQPPAPSARRPGAVDAVKPTEIRGMAGIVTSQRQLDWLLGLLLLAAAILAYQPVWRAGMIWDDDDYMTPPRLRALEGLARIWTQPGATHQYYPLVHTVFWVEHKLWGDATAGYHWLNILLHAFSALLLVKLLRQLKIPGAWLAAALFVLHPVEVESVAWITELKNTLSGLFYLGAALAYLGFDRNRGRGNYFMALGLFLLGLLSKTVIASLPAALLVIFWWQRGKLSWRRDALPLVPFFIAGIGSGLFTAWMERTFVGAQGAEYNFSIVERFLIAGRAMWFYLAKLCWPANLSFMYARWNVSQAVWWQYLFPAAALLVAGVLVWRRWRGPLAALLFFAGTLFPALGFVNVFPFRYSFVADHFQYLASLGPLTLAAAGLTAALGFLRPGRRFLGLLLCAALLLVLGAMTWRQCGIYANRETLWRATVRLDPNSWMAQVNLGDVYLEQGKMDEGIRLLQQGVQLNPGFVFGHLSLGLALLHHGKLDEAIAQAQKAQELDPALGAPHFILGECYLRQNRFDEAVSQYQTALARKLEVGEADAHYGLASSLAHLGRTGEAVAEFEKALQLRHDDAPTRLSLGDALLQEGKLEEAIAQFQKAVETKPDLPDARVKLGGALAQRGRMDEAIAQLQKAVQLKPDLAPAHLNLGNALLQQGRVEEAIPHYEKALQINPGYGKAHSNLASALLRQGKMGDAITHLQRALQLEPKDASLQIELAWLLATCPDASLRNGEKAVSLARQANAGTGGENPAVLHTLAAAYAEAGRFAEAVETARRALSLAGTQSNRALSAQLEYELSLYQAGSPLHAAGSTH